MSIRVSEIYPIQETQPESQGLKRKVAIARKEQTFIIYRLYPFPFVLILLWANPRSEVIRRTSLDEHIFQEFR